MHLIQLRASSWGMICFHADFHAEGGGGSVSILCVVRKQTSKNRFCLPMYSVYIPHLTAIHSVWFTDHLPFPAPGERISLPPELPSLLFQHGVIFVDDDLLYSTVEIVAAWQPLWEMFSLLVTMIFICSLFKSSHSSATYAFSHMITAHLHSLQHCM